MDKAKKRIMDIPYAELQKNMADYGKKRSASVRASRKYLRSLGMQIKSDGTWCC